MSLFEMSKYGVQNIDCLVFRLLTLNCSYHCLPVYGVSSAKNCVFHLCHTNPRIPFTVPNSSSKIWGDISSQSLWKVFLRPSKEKAVLIIFCSVPGFFLSHLNLPSLASSQGEDGRLCKALIHGKFFKVYKNFRKNLCSLPLCLPPG